MTRKRREYTREFRLEAVSLVIEHQRKVAEVAVYREYDNENTFERSLVRASLTKAFQGD